MTAYLGTCNDMCPASERNCPSRQLSIFECDELNQPNEQAMVKEYRRAGADQKEPPPEDLRTPMALEMTMDYLTANIVNDKRSQNPELALEWYDFLWDRFRAVRKDITQQKICDEAATRLVERCARFHVHCCYAMSHVEDFDANMNKRSLNDCLQMLRQMYTDLRNEGIFCSNQFEFQKYDILLHLDRDPLSTNVLMKTSDHRNSKEMKFIIRIYNAYSSNDFFTFFKLLERADYMTSCILSLFASKMRLVGLRIIVASCTSRQMTLYPAELAIKVLGFDDLEDLGKFAALYDMEIQEKEGRYLIVIRKDLITALRQVEPSVSFKSVRLVECKTPPSQGGAPIESQARMPMPMLSKIDNEAELCEDIEPMDEEDKDIDSEEQTPDGPQELYFMDVKPIGAGSIIEQSDNEFGIVNSEPIVIPPSTPKILSQPKEVKAGVGASPVPEATLQSVPEAKVQWLKDDEPIPATLLRDGHIEAIVEKTDQSGVVKHALTINEARPSDAPKYTLKAENPVREAIFEPIKPTLNRSVSPLEKPIVEALPDDVSPVKRKPLSEASPDEMAAMIMSTSPEEVVAGLESSPQVVEEMPSLAEILLRREQAAELMPAGRMRRSYYSPKLKVIANDPPPVKVFKSRTDTFYTKTIQDIKSKIAEESKANSNLLTLLNFFESQ